jgi:arylsulfatase A-like enzyme
MNSSEKQIAHTRVSLLQLFRLIFILFSLYLLRNAFYRWDGFKFYATFSEYIPAVALVSILWSITAFVTTIVAWTFFRLSETVFDRAGLRIRTEHMLIYGGVVSLAGAFVWKIKRLLWTDVQTSYQLKLAVFIFVVFVSMCLVWMLRNKAESWFKIVQERITPLVWLFGIFVIASIPIVGIYSLGEESYKPITDKIKQSVEPVSTSNRPNIVLVIFDTLTARDMSLYGYERETTPFINKWARDATVFTRAEAENNHTTPTTASLMTGKRVWTHQVYHQFGTIPVKVDTESLPGELKKNGYFNAAFVVNPSASTKALGILDKFDISLLMTEFLQPENQVFFDLVYGDISMFIHRMFGDKIRIHNWIFDARLLGILEPVIMPRYKLMNPEYAKTAVPPEIAFNRFLDIYDNLPEPFFAWIHVLPPHAPYLPSGQYREMFGPYLPPERYKSFTSDIDIQDMHDMRILYDEFIRYCDSQFGEFITRLEKNYKSKNTTVILTSDHGESFQHDVFQHAVPALYEQLTHIPLIIKEPGQIKGKVIDNIIEQIDIPATILNLAHIPVPAWIEGRSLLPLMRGENFPPRPAFSMYFEKNPSRGHQISKGLVAVWEGDHKLIHYLEEGKSLLFNLKQDPEEMDNLIDKEPEIANHLLDLLETNLDRANERIRSGNQSG